MGDTACRVHRRAVHLTRDPGGFDDVVVRQSAAETATRAELIAPVRPPLQFAPTLPVWVNGAAGIDSAPKTARPGEQILVHDVGAYGYVMASNYNARRRAAEVLVDGDRFAVVTRRETFEDLMRLDVDEPHNVGADRVLNAIAGPLSDITFCPTGGISQETAPAFLALKNVACVGGSWLTPKDAMKAGDWAHITALAKAASALRG